jgi:hypothetical protein
MASGTLPEFIATIFLMLCFTRGPVVSCIEDRDQHITQYDVGRYLCRLRDRRPIAQEPVLETSHVYVWEDHIEVRGHCEVIAPFCRCKEWSEPSLFSRVAFQLCHGYLVLEVCESSQYMNRRAVAGLSTGRSLVVNANPSTIFSKSVHHPHHTWGV